MHNIFVANFLSFFSWTKEEEEEKKEEIIEEKKEEEVKKVWFCFCQLYFIKLQSKIVNNSHVYPTIPNKIPSNM